MNSKLTTTIRSASVMATLSATLLAALFVQSGPARADSTASALLAPYVAWGQSQVKDGYVSGLKVVLVGNQEDSQATYTDTAFCPFYDRWIKSRFAWAHTVGFASTEPNSDTGWQYFSDRTSNSPFLNKQPINIDLDALNGCVYLHTPTGTISADLHVIPGSGVMVGVTYPGKPRTIILSVFKYTKQVPK